MAIDTATGKEAPAEISSERVKDIFSTIAKKYERFNAVSSFGAYKTWLTGMMKQAPISANDDVLDIAGGTGDVSFTVARATHPRHIQCSDLVSEMLDVARVATEQEARDLMSGNDAAGAGYFNISGDGAAGYFTVDADGMPTVHVKAGVTPDSLDSAYQSILKTIGDGYVRNAALIEDVAAENPAALADMAAVEKLLAA